MEIFTIEQFIFKYVATNRTFVRNFSFVSSFQHDNRINRKTKSSFTSKENVLCLYII